ncbi:MAG: LamG-like jellyroll fold domain-containing protein, partial [Gemmataceae bacterium]
MDGETAALLDGSSGYFSTATSFSDPGSSAYSIEIAFKTIYGWANGGKLIGFEDTRTGAGGSWDRMIYMTNLGALVFDHYGNSGVVSVESPSSYNDGKWHLAEGVWDGSNLLLYVDGSEVASLATASGPQNYSGYWRMGYGDIGSPWPNFPNSLYFAGTIEKGAVWNTAALSASQVLAHYSAFTIGNCSGATPTPAPSPAIFVGNSGGQSIT